MERLEARATESTSRQKVPMASEMPQTQRDGMIVAPTVSVGIFHLRD